MSRSDYSRALGTDALLHCDAFIHHFKPPLLTEGSDHAGLLRGRTVAIKDNFDIKGVVTGAGSPFWAETHIPAMNNAHVVDRLLHSGASILGKTQMDELAYSLMGVNAHYGTPLNPAALDRVPGGSSSGSASAVAESLADIGIGSDTGGSVRLPASFCGLYGFRPTHGIIASRGLVPLAPSFDTVGFFARNAELMLLIGTVLGIKVTAKKPYKVRLPSDLWSIANPATAEILRTKCDLLFPELDLSDKTPLAHDTKNWRLVFQTIQAWEIWKVFGDWINTHDPAFGPGTKERFEMASRITALQFEEASDKRQVISKLVSARIMDNGLLVIPTAPGPAPLMNVGAGDLDVYRGEALSLLCVAGLCGLPQLSLPVAQIDGAPIGLSIIGPAGSDGQLLGLAAALSANFQA